ncbi:MAG: exopolysaccharide biosynthesis polyprenyl glycosylphosphotransferase [Nocardioidaceae bacterium]
MVRDFRFRGRRRPSTGAPFLIGLVPALFVAFFAQGNLVPWLCAGAWFLAAAAQAGLQRRDVAPRTQARSDLRVGGFLVSVVALAAVAGLLSIPDARKSVAVVLVAVASTMAVRFVQPRRSVLQRVVLVGTEDDVESYADSVRGTDVLVAGCYVVDAGSAVAVQPSLGVPTTTSVETLDELVTTVTADVVLVLPGHATGAEVVRRLSWALEDNPVSVGVLTPVSSVAAHRLHTSELGDRAVLEIGAVGASALQARAKHALDRFGAAVLLLVVSPLLLLMVAAVRLDSTGSGLFVQTRVGRHGKPFRMFKLRSMYADAESMKHALLEHNEADGVLFKIQRDPRVTRVGYWLRRSSLDELPQLLNVLRGEMSLIGPRPALPSEVAAYDADARRRLVVKPGITGLWQVSGRSDLQWDESLKLDLYYADNWRLVDDFAIAARTVSAVTMARGAY